jgi:hypothetical protein
VGLNGDFLGVTAQKSESNQCGEVSNRL